MWWPTEKPNYKKEIVKDYFNEFKVHEDEEFKKNKILNWLNKIPDDAFIEVYSSTECSGGCGAERSIIIISAFKRREETDKEYKKRISREEKEYNEYIQEVKNREYQKDLEEYNRIKEKYNL